MIEITTVFHFYFDDYFYTCSVDLPFRFYLNDCLNKGFFWDKQLLEEDINYSARDRVKIRKEVRKCKDGFYINHIDLCEGNIFHVDLTLEKIENNEK